MGAVMRPRPRVLHLFSGWEFSNAAESIVDLCRLLGRRGLVADLACARAPDPARRPAGMEGPPASRLAGLRPIRKPSLEQIARERQVEPILDFRLQRSINPFVHWPDIYRLIEFLDREEVEIVHVHTAHDHYVGSRAARRANGQPYVVRTSHSGSPLPPAGRNTSIKPAMIVLLLAVGIAVVIGPGILNVVIIIALFTWYYPCRIVRSATASTKQMTFVAAARTMGARPRRILLVHLLPQVWGPLLVYATSIIANNILFEAGLSYLGVGVPAPTASWGSMLSDAVTSSMYTVDLPLALIPGLALLITMLSFNLLGDGLCDALDPKATRR